MTKSCLYCAQEDTKKDIFGYCKEYDCLSRSGKRDRLNYLVRKAKDIYTLPDKTGQISGPVSNFYSTRHRAADGIKNEANREFGFIPPEVIEALPLKYRYEKWDKNIIW